jgi:nicotinamide riboside transporter PnuC
MLKRQWLAVLTANQKGGECYMLWTICVILIVLWLLGMVSSYTMGGLIHILLVIAIIVVLVNVIQGRRSG